MYWLYVACLTLITVATAVFDFVCVQKLVSSGFDGILLNLALSVFGLDLGLTILLIPAESISAKYLSDSFVGWSVGIVVLAAFVSSFAGWLLAKYTVVITERTYE